MTGDASLKAHRSAQLPSSIPPPIAPPPRAMPESAGKKTANGDSSEVAGGFVDGSPPGMRIQCSTPDIRCRARAHIYSNTQKVV